MPELPEVETVVRDLCALVIGRRIERAVVGLAKMVPTGAAALEQRLGEAVFRAVDRRGKFIVFSLSRNLRLVVHLKMTGQFLWHEADQPQPDHVHVRFHLAGPEKAHPDGGLDCPFAEGPRELLFRDPRQFGRLRCFTEAEYNAWLAEEGPGPDPYELSVSDFRALLARRAGRIKPLLLDQRLISGVGNIYADEALFAARVHPMTPARDLTPTRARRLHRELLRILTEAIELRGSTTRDYVGPRGIGGQYQNEHQVYGRDGQPCPVCGARIIRLVVAGRGTFICPRCQPQP